MKTFFRACLCAVLISSVAFARGPKEHRGFYFSAGIGPAYQSFSSNYTTQNSRYRWDAYSQQYDYFYTTEKTENSYDAFVFPAFDFRLGKSIGNLIAIYTTFDFMFDKGNWEGSYEEHGADGSVDVSKKVDTENSFMLSGGAGLGFEIYPFLNPNSVMRGFHIGESSSINMMGVESIGETIDVGEGAFLANRINVGMDWWVSETWSLGVEFSYTYFSVIDVDVDEEPERHLFRLMFRLTRG